MFHHLFELTQDENGEWYYHNRGNPRSVWESFPAKEQAERAAQQFADRLREGVLTESIVRNRLRLLIKLWVNERVRETNLPHPEVLLDVRLGAQDALDDLCPRG
jgi:hypothetical protein